MIQLHLGLLILCMVGFISAASAGRKSSIIVVVHVVQTHDLDILYGGEQSLCKVRADKTSYTRDENALVAVYIEKVRSAECT